MSPFSPGSPAEPLSPFGPVGPAGPGIPARPAGPGEPVTRRDGHKADPGPGGASCLQSQGPGIPSGFCRV